MAAPHEAPVVRNDADEKVKITVLSQVNKSFGGFSLAQNQVEHDRLSIKAVRWFRSRMTNNYRWAPEVHVRDQYRADVVGVGRFSGSSLYKRFAPHLYDEDHRFGESQLKQERIICVFESKRTCSDYRCTFPSDFENVPRAEPAGNLHFIVTDNDKVCPNNDPPGFWGLLRTKGPGLSVASEPTFADVSDEFRHKLSRALLWKIPPKTSRLKKWESRLERREGVGPNYSYGKI